MATLAPKWAKNAVATTRGWVVNGELVKAQKMTQEQADQINGVTPAVPVPQPVVVVATPVLEPAPVIEFAPEPVVETTEEEAQG
jgi:hypothetical protein